MGINMANKAIINDEICREAAIREIKRRYEAYKEEYRKGQEKKSTVKRMEEIMKKI